MAYVHAPETRSYNMSRISGNNIRKEIQEIIFQIGYGSRFALTTS